MIKPYVVLLKKYFDEQSFIRSDIESFNNFVEKELGSIIKENHEVEPTIIPANVDEFKIRFDGSRRDIFPIEARQRKMTYSAPVYITVSAHINGAQRESFETQIGNLPIMLKSRNCHLHNLGREELINHGEDPDEPGGYFIINGNERIIVMTEDLAENQPFFQLILCFE